MTKQEVYNLLVSSKRPIDCFGDVSNEVELKKSYLKFAKIIHPDTASPRDEYICNSGFAILQDLYEKGQEELKKGIYSLIEATDLYEKSDILFELKIHGKDYKFYENIYQGEVSDIYRGLCDKELVCLKLALDESDNDLLRREYETLKTYRHQSFPIVKDFIKINNCSAIVMEEIKGENLADIMQRNPKGLDPQVVIWVMERLFSAVGYLHSNYIVHGNIIPENIILNKVNHNASLTGFSFHISNANEVGAEYQIRNDDFSAPEVSKTEIVMPQSDIYSLGKLAVYMLGGSLKTNGMPLSVDSSIRTFIRKMVEVDKTKRSGDAWKLWDEWREIRKKLYGNAKYVQIDF